MLLKKYFLIYLFTVLGSQFISAQNFTMNLTSNWKFHQVGKEEWYPASVPGCVHTDLLNNKLIQDPFYRTNEKDLQWIDKVDWEYETVFNIPGAFLQNENIILKFYGLDTYADVFLNDQNILIADNMFREWNVDCKKYLKPGENKLRVLFHSPIRRDIPKLEKLGYALPAINDQSENGGLGNQKVSVFARKAPYHYGWDWGPRFVTSGIWRSVRLTAWNNARINTIQIVQNSLNKNLANLTFNVEVNSNIDGYFDLRIRSSEHEHVNKRVKLQKGLNEISTSFKIDNPILWWPNGLGDAYLYNFETTLTLDEKIIDTKQENFGLRTINIIQKDDAAGRSFYFEVNGYPVFMKGANYIPSDIFLNRVTEQEYEKLIKSAVDANMNMLRVWGGGIYENDIFYDLCDKNGILLWQDFMFACCMYPGDEAFLENVRQEAIDNVKRLRNHPSIALWCGNNEIEDAWNYWHWQDKYTENQRKEIQRAYDEKFLNIIPSVVKEYDGTRYYWPSSPSSDFGKPSKKEFGDMHYWGVWHGKEPFEAFQNNIGRFVSEYGFQSFPEFKTVQAYTTPDDWNIESDVMMAHQRSGIGNLRIRDYLTMYYKTPKDFQSFLYVGQVLQANGIKQAIEAHRRNMPYCMGSLYWQIDDCWPVASWSSMDYYKRWKALHYIARKAYQNILAAPLLKEDDLQFYIISDLLTPIKADMQIKVMDLNGKELHSKSIPVKIEANASKVYAQINKKELTGNNDEDKLFVDVKLISGDEILTENILYFKQPKNLSLEKPEIKMEIDETNGGYEIELTTTKFAKDVYLSTDEECFFSDNYFDLIPGTTKKIVFQTDKQTENLTAKIKVISLVDSY